MQGTTVGGSAAASHVKRSSAGTLGPRDRILSGLTFVVPKSPLPGGYLAGMTLVAVALVLLPVAYGTLVAFLAWLAGWHAYQAVASLGYGPYWLFHLPMAVAGAVLVTFLVKPVFLRGQAKTVGVVTLSAEEQPLLFEAVARLCAATGARRPTAIEVDCVPNAHARFNRLTDSFRRGDGDLVLRIGLPLAAGLTARQLLGVVGHELGHFNQRHGMAGSYLVRRLTAFFAKVVFHRDRVDAAVERLRRKRNGWARLAYLLTVATVEPMRGVLWLMLVGGELLACGVLRRMEHDADAVEAHVAGGADFVRTARLLLFLDIAHHRARADLAHAHEQHRLADDLPRLIVANAKQLREHRRDILKLLGETRTRWFDTHPCYADRVAHVERLGAAGLFDVDLPASKLFHDFRDLCRRATGQVYADALPADDRAVAKLVPTDELAAERATQRAAAVVLRRYFRGHVVAGRPMFPVAADLARPVADVAAAAADLADARRLVDDAGRSGDALPATVRRYAEAFTLVPILEAQLTLCRVFCGNPKSDRLSRQARRRLDEQQASLAETTTILASFERTGRDRLTLALRLMGTDAVAAHLGDDAAVGRAGVAQLIGVCAALEAALPTANQLAAVLPAIRMLSAAHNPRQPFQPLVKQVLAKTAEAYQLHAKLRRKLGSVAYPFAHGTAGTTVAAHVVRQVPESRDPAATVAAAAAALDRYHELTFRSLSVLTQWAEMAEAAAGLPPLAEVPEPAEADVDGKRGPTAAAKRSRKFWLGYGGRAAAGLALVSGLVYLSVNPPALPVGGGDGPARYQPAAFHLAMSAPTRPSFPTPAFGRLPPPWLPPTIHGYQGRMIGGPPIAPPTFRPPTFSPPTYPRSATPPGFGQRVPTPYPPRPYAPPSGGYSGGGPRGGRR